MTEITHHLERFGAVSAHRRPHLRHQIRHALERGDLVRLLPGTTCVAAGTEHDWRARVAAAREHDPRNVIIGASAAALTYWPERPVDVVEVAGRVHPDAPGFRFGRSLVDPLYVRNQIAADVWAAVDLLGKEGARAVDRLREHRVVQRAELDAALASMPGRRGNRQRARIIAADAWSEAERAAQTVLTDARIGGWQANCSLRLGGKVWIIDLVFARARLAVHIDGWKFHSDRDAFERDRNCDADLIRHGWRTVRVTWRQLHTPGYFVSLIHGLLGHRALRRAPSASR